VTVVLDVVNLPANKLPADQEYCSAATGRPTARVGDDARYRDSRDRYRDMAKTLEFEGHIAWAEAMP
jgi:hypothetical protein